MNHLPTSVHEGELRQRFESFGSIASISIITGGKMNYAYINFTLEYDAKRACQAMNGQSIRGRKIGVKMQEEVSMQSLTQHTVKVSNLSKNTTEEELKKMFSFYGAVELLSIKLVQCPIQPFNYAYVNYSSRDDATKAERDFNGTKYMKVQYQDTSSRQTSLPSTEVQHASTSQSVPMDTSSNPSLPHYSYVPQPQQHQLQRYATPASTCTIKVSIFGSLQEEDLDEAFRQYGSIKGNIKVIMGSPNYAYINYNTPEEASKAIEANIRHIRKIAVQANLKLPVKATRSATSQDRKCLHCDHLTAILLLKQHEDKLHQFKEEQQIRTIVPKSGVGIEVWGDPSKLESAGDIISGLLKEVESGIQKITFTLPCHCLPLFKDQAIINMASSIESRHGVEFSVIDCSPQANVIPLDIFRRIIAEHFSTINDLGVDTHTVDLVLKVGSFPKFLMPTFSPSTTFRWLWEKNDGGFTAYTPELCDEINKQFAASSKGSFQCSISTDIGNVTYSINFASFTQVNQSTGKSRAIKHEMVTLVQPKWSYCDDSNEFVPYRASDSDVIECMYTSQRPGNLTIDSIKYTLDFSTMEQINSETNHRRSIRRDISPSVSTAELSLQVRGVQRSIQQAVDDLKQEICKVSTLKSLPLQGSNDPELLSSLMQTASQYLVTASIHDGRIKVQGVQWYNELVAMQLRLEILTHQSKAAVNCGGQLRVPSNWQPQSHKIVLVLVSAGSREWNKVHRLMQKTMSTVQITKLERVQNLYLWNKYALAKEHMAEKNNGKVNERKLFHGTKHTPPEKIFKSEQGFDFRHASRGMWGMGVYFAVNASYSHAGFSYLTSDRKNQMIVARVLTGETCWCKPDSSLKLPPVKPISLPGQAGTGTFEDERYDSVSGCHPNGTDVVVIYDFEKAYPAYLITYTT